MQNRTFLALLRPIFCEKLKTVPPKGKQPPSNVWISEFGRKISLNFGEDLFLVFGDHLILDWKNVWNSEFGRKSVSISVKTFFFFGDHLILGGKNVWVSEKFRLNFRANRVKLIQEQWKFGSRSFALSSLFQKSPPPLFLILATRLVLTATAYALKLMSFFTSPYGNVYLSFNM